jgi:hypothetical protein
MKVKVTYSHCSISVIGTQIVCPLCRTLVKSGERHECKKPRAEQKPVIDIGPKARKVAV